MNVALAGPARPIGRPAARRRPAASLCLLCGAILGRASVREAKNRAVCGGCAERLELELSLSDYSACHECGRHRELCAVMPCTGPANTATMLNVRPIDDVPQLAFMDNLQRRHVSGADRVRAIERLAATHLGVRELGRRTGFAPSTISRWLKIDRCALLKRALQSEVLDIGRAKLLADAPVSALPDLIPVAASCSRADLSRRVASLRGMAAPPEATYQEAGGSRRLLKALQILESVSSMTAAERAIIERLRARVVDLLDA